VIDYGDAPVLPGDVAASHAAIERTVGEVVAAGAIPVVLGGDHSIAEPDIRAVAASHGPLGLVHFDAHTDTAAAVFGAARSHGTPMYRLVEQGVVDPRATCRSACAATGRASASSPGSASMASRRSSCTTSARRRSRRSSGGRSASSAAGPVFLSIDIDVLDPSVAPGTGTPEPGGMGAAELMWAVRALATELELVGAELVEVIPTAVGSADITALDRGPDRARAADRDRAAARGGER
jgi:arginase family enzyme